MPAPPWQPPGPQLRGQGRAGQGRAGQSRTGTPRIPSAAPAPKLLPGCGAGAQPGRGPRAEAAPGAGAPPTFEPRGAGKGTERSCRRRDPHPAAGRAVPSVPPSPGCGQPAPPAPNPAGPRPAPPVPEPGRTRRPGGGAADRAKAQSRRLLPHRGHGERQLRASAAPGAPAPHGARGGGAAAPTPLGGARARGRKGRDRPGNAGLRLRSPEQFYRQG